MNISEIKKLLEQKNLNPSLRVKWVSPENIAGLNEKEALKIREGDERSSEEDLSDLVYDYIQECYKQGKSCLPVNCPYSLTEAYVRAMVYLIVEFNNTLAATSVPPPENVTSSEAKKCLPFFVEVLLNKELTEFQIDTLQMYICDFYQYDDLWDPPEGRFNDEFTKLENLLVGFLGTRDLSIDTLKAYGIPQEIMPLVEKTRLIQSVKS